MEQTGSRERHQKLCKREQQELQGYFRAVLDVLKHHRATVNLWKCKWFHDQCEFVGMDVRQGGNRLA
eukprot:1469048-Ditylum_brightwellii.AAC.1